MSTNPYASIAIKDEGNPYANIAIKGDQPAGLVPQKPGFFKSLGTSLGIDPDAKSAEAKQHPIQSGIEAAAGPAGQAAEGLYGGAKRIGGEISQAFHSKMSGDDTGAKLHSIAAIPFVGPDLIRAGEQAGGDESKPYLSRVMDAAKDPGVMGTLGGAAIKAAPLALGGVDSLAEDRPLIGRLPSRAHAGEILQDIRNQAQDVPLIPRNTMPAVERLSELKDAGGKSATPLNALSKRTTKYMTPSTKGVPQEPILFPEARDIYSNVSEVTRQSPLQTLMGRGLKPTMLRQAGIVKSSLNADLTDAANSIGRGEDYTGAMKEYANASKLRKMGILGGAALGEEGLRRSGLLGKITSRIIP
jgi:hypothetical protein